MKNTLIRPHMSFQEYANVVLEHGNLTGGGTGECSFQRGVRRKISDNAFEMLGDITITPAGCFVTRDEWIGSQSKTEIIALGSVKEGLELVKKLMAAKGEKSSDFEGSVINNWTQAFESGKHQQLLQNMAGKDSSDQAWGGLANRTEAQRVFLTAIPTDIHAMVTAPNCPAPGVEKIGIAINCVQAKRATAAVQLPSVPQFMKRLLVDSAADPSRARQNAPR